MMSFNDAYACVSRPLWIYIVDWLFMFDSKPLKESVDSNFINREIWIQYNCFINWNNINDVFPPDDLSSGPYTQSIIRFFFLVYQADVSIFYTSNLYWWGKAWPVDGLPFPDTGCPVPDVSIYYMSNINELPDGILFHWFCKCTPPWMFLPLDIPSEYRPEHVTFGLLCVIFKFPSRIFCRRVPGFATDCPCGVWCRGLTTCLLYVGPPLEF